MFGRLYGGIRRWKGTQTLAGLSSPRRASNALVGLVVCLGLITSLQAAPEVMILGFDGADPNLVRKYSEEGLLPNLTALSEEGTFSPLLPTNPPQTPVSWSSFATGLNPGKTEIFDFLYRQEETYVPDFALATAGKETFLFGERNGWILGSVLGLVAALLVLILLRIFGAVTSRGVSSAPAAGGVVGWLLAVLAFGGVTFLTAAPLGQLLPVEIPTASNNRIGKPFWTVAAEAGKKVRVIRVPVTFPAEELPGDSKMLSGLGVPDMRKRVGTPTLFSSDPSFDAGNNQFSLELTKLPARRGLIETKVIGPFNYPFYIFPLDRARQRFRDEGLSRAERKEAERRFKDELEQAGYTERIDVPLMLDIGDDSVKWELSGQTGELAVGEWSDWVTVTFPVNWLVDKLEPLQGIGRFKLLALEPEVQLYFSPVNFHPDSHPVDFSSPPEWGEQLAEDGGLFKTIGWAIDTWSYPSNVGGIDLFLEDMESTVHRFGTLMDQTLAEPDLDMFVQIFYFTDRAGHMLWHQLDDKHPLYDPTSAEKYENAMRSAYQKMDELVGRAREKAGPETLFVVLSDHGFSSFRRQININTWLYQNGYLALSGKVGTRNLEQLFDKDVTNVNVFEGIDWARTKAWAMGLGAVYINLVGREPKGTVMPGVEYDRVVQEIKEGLEAAVDPETGEKPIFKVYLRDEMYTGYDPGKIPDLRPANRLGYRVSWQDTLGGLSTDVFEDNDRVWSGDHCSLEPTEVRGILFVNRELDVDDPEIVDVAPSILAELGLDPAEPLDGRTIWKR